MVVAAPELDLEVFAHVNAAVIVAKKDAGATSYCDSNESLGFTSKTCAYWR